jgi:hypothetical protein
MVYGWRDSSPGPATFEAAIKDAELVVRGLNAGVEGFNRWSFVNRGDLDGQWQMISTWDPTNKALLKTITPFPNSYFVYGLISRLTAKHSTLVATERTGGELEGLPRVFTAALLSPKGHSTWMVINDAPCAWNAEFHLSGLRGVRLYKYQVSSAVRDEATLKIQPLRFPRLPSEPGSFRDSLPAMSLTVLSTYKLSPNERGVIAE